MSERACDDCGYCFRFDPAYWEARGLSYPHRCLRCRAERRGQKDPPGPRMQGVITMIAGARTFAFVQPFDGPELYVRCRDIPHGARVGDRVEFEVVDGAPKQRATCIVVLQD